GLEQQHRMSAARRQPIGEHAAGGSRADDDVVPGGVSRDDRVRAESRRLAFCTERWRAPARQRAAQARGAGVAFWSMDRIRCPSKMALKLHPRLESILRQEYPRFSDAEYARRHVALEALMQKADVDHLLVITDHRAGNAPQWVTGW